MISFFLTAPRGGGGQGARNDKPLLQQGNQEPLSHPGPSRDEETDPETGPGRPLADAASFSRSLMEGSPPSGLCVQTCHLPAR